MASAVPPSRVSSLHSVPSTSDNDRPSIIPRSSLPVPRRPARRRNHIRSKPLLPPAPPPLHCTVVCPEEEDLEVIILREQEQLVATVAEIEPISIDFRRALLDFSWYVAVLFVLQTLVAVVVFGWMAPEEKEWDGEGTEKAGVGYGEDVEFGKRVEEIRAMAREARANEAKSEVSDGGDANDEIRRDVRGEIGRKAERMRRNDIRMLAAGLDAASGKVEGAKNGSGLDPIGQRKSGKGSIRRKLLHRKFRADIINRKRPKGFAGLKNDDKSISDVGDSSIRKTNKDNILKESPDMCNTPNEFKGDLSDTYSESVDSSVLLPNDSLGNKHSSISKEGNIDRFRCREDSAISMVNNDTPRGIQKNMSSSKADAVKQTNTMQKSPMLNYNFDGSDTSSFKAFDDNKLEAFQVSPNTTADSCPLSPTGSAESKSVINGLLCGNEKLWWSKLPFVLGIFLRRGSGRDAIKGLYNLKMDPHSNDSSSSRTIFFQDRTDATNLCYILETFFEDLDGVRADIVPLSVKELDEAIHTKVLNVVVIRKGQLQLYAGQPLAEVEMAIRSIIEHTLLEMQSKEQ